MRHLSSLVMAAVATLFLALSVAECTHHNLCVLPCASSAWIWFWMGCVSCLCTLGVYALEKSGVLK